MRFKISQTERSEQKKNLKRIQIRPPSSGQAPLSACNKPAQSIGRLRQNSPTARCVDHKKMYFFISIKIKLFMQILGLGMEFESRRTLMSLEREAKAQKNLRKFT